MSPSRTVRAHLVWEGVLLFLLAATVVALTATGELFSGPGLWFSVASTGLIAAGFALSLRTATPNLAVGAIAAMTAMLYAKLVAEDWPGIPAGVAALVVALLLGLLMGLFTGRTPAPAWAVTLGGSAIALAVTLALADDNGFPLQLEPMAGGSGTAAVWTLVFLAVSIGGGAWWQSRGAGATLTPDRLRGPLVGIGGSSVLAGLGGIAAVTYLGVPPTDTYTRLLLAAGAALLGGVSVLGGRGGIAGTALATALIVVTNYGLVRSQAPLWTTVYLVAILAIIIGLVVSRVLESVAPSDRDEELGRAPGHDPVQGG
jgi:ribose transport system permease protein